MKEINLKLETVEVKAKTRKLRPEQYPERFDPEKDEIVVENVTGLSDVELHEKMMKDPHYRKVFLDFLQEEREKKIKRILG